MHTKGALYPVPACCLRLRSAQMRQIQLAIEVLKSEIDFFETKKENIKIRKSFHEEPSEGFTG